MPQNRPVVVFLYTELAGYIRFCMESLARAGAEVHVFAYPVNSEAPFDFRAQPHSGQGIGLLCTYHERKLFTDQELLLKVRGLSANIVVCSGWIDKGYIAICESLPSETTKVLAFDNQRPANLKSWLSLAFARWRYKPIFNFAWVPGAPQVAYAKLLGFKSDAVYTGFYTIEVAKYNALYLDRMGKSIPKRFAFMGRYVGFKGVRELWQAFEELALPGWELWCAGQGVLFESRPEMAGLHHLGFVQPNEIDTFVSQGGVFVLPSWKEPWGVVLHEFAAAGFPLICTDRVGAASAFLEEGANGYQVKSQSVEALKNAMRAMAGQTEDGLRKMGALSAEKAKNVTIEKWVESIFDMLERSTL